MSFSTQQFEEIQRSIKYLESHGFELASVWDAFWARHTENKKPSEYTLRYPVPRNAKPEVGPTEVLLSTNLCDGHRYKLTAAQRKILRERYHMTTTPEVDVIELAFYGDLDTPTQRYVDYVKLRSVLHVPNNQRATLTIVRIDDFGEFLATAAAIEAAWIEARRTAAVAKESDPKKVTKKSKPPLTEEEITEQYL